MPVPPLFFNPISPADPIRFGRKTTDLMSSPAPKASETEALLNDDFFLKLDPKTLFNEFNRPSRVKEVQLNCRNITVAPQEQKSEQPEKKETISPKPLPQEVITPTETPSVDAVAPTLPSTISETVFNNFLEKKEGRPRMQNFVKMAVLTVGLGLSAYLATHGIVIGGKVLLATDMAQRLGSGLGFIMWQLSDAVSKLLLSDTMASAFTKTVSWFKKQIGGLIGANASEPLKFSGTQEPTLQQSEDPGYRILLNLWNVMDETEKKLAKADSHEKRVDIALSMEESLYTGISDFLLNNGSDDQKSKTKKLNDVFIEYKAYLAEVPPSAQLFQEIPAAQKKQVSVILQHSLNSGIPELENWATGFAHSLGMTNTEIDRYAKTSQLQSNTTGVGRVKAC